MRTVARCSATCYSTNIVTGISPRCSMESSKQYYIRTCWDNEEDGTKVDSLLKHISPRPDAALVREWMEKNWLEWEEENPR